MWQKEQEVVNHLTEGPEIQFRRLFILHVKHSGYLKNVTLVRSWNIHERYQKALEKLNNWLICYICLQVWTLKIYLTVSNYMAKADVQLSLLLSLVSRDHTLRWSKNHATSVLRPLCSGVIMLLLLQVDIFVAIIPLLIPWRYKVCKTDW